MLVTKIQNQQIDLLVKGRKIEIRVLLIYVTIFLSIVTYSFWEYIKNETGFGIFYKGNAICVFTMAIVIYIQNKGKFYSFYLLCITLQNVLDELIFDNTITDISEYVFAIILPVIWLIKNKKDARKTSTRKL